MARDLLLGDCLLDESCNYVRALEGGISALVEDDGVLQSRDISAPLEDETSFERRQDRPSRVSHNVFRT